MHPDFEPDKVEEHLRQARRQHMKVATRISRLLSQPEAMSTVSDQLRLQKVVQAFTAILLINSDPEDEQLAVFPSPRQRALHSQQVGSDVLVIPRVDDIFRHRNAGRLRFNTAEKTRSIAVL